MDSIALKERGNEEFKVGNYQNAIGLYSQAINSSSTNSQLYSNRALCYKKLGNYEEVSRKDSVVKMQKLQSNCKTQTSRLICSTDKLCYIWGSMKRPQL